LIRFEGIWKSFGAKAILRGVDFHVERGETRVIVGQSGQGKSVTLKLICALLWPDRGTVTVDGHTLRRGDREALARVRHGVDMLFQFGALFDSLTIRENVGFVLYERSGLPRREIDARVAECLEMVNLPGIEDLMPADLSGGMRKRVGLARALIGRPEILLYDEPTSGLDPVTADLINDLILETGRRFGVTSVVVTHDMTSAYKIGDRISMLADGQLITTGTPDEIRATADGRVRQFIEGRAHGPLTAGAVAEG
jgi:phospholipid/cholesterol/gamma-HCH transport system ATP-binding protein